MSGIGALGPIEAVIFDKDGTLFDFGATWESWAAAFLRRMSDGDEARAAEVGTAVGFDLTRLRFDRNSVIIAGTPADIVDALLPHAPVYDQTTLLDLLNEEAVAAPQVEAVPLIPFLQDLRGRGLKLGVATNDAEVPARAHLDAAGISGAFDFIAGFDSGYGGKPAPGQLLTFCQQVGVMPERCVMVGDSTHDLRAGRAAGMATVGVLTGLAERSELIPYADVVLPDISGLPDWLDRLSP